MSTLLSLRVALKCLSLSKPFYFGQVRYFCQQANGLHNFGKHIDNAVECMLICRDWILLAHGAGRGSADLANDTNIANKSNIGLITRRATNTAI